MSMANTDMKDERTNIVIEPIETKEFVERNIEIKPISQIIEEDASPVKIKSPRRIDTPEETYMSQKFDTQDLEYDGSIVQNISNIDANLVESRVEEDKQNEYVQEPEQPTHTHIVVDNEKIESQGQTKAEQLKDFYNKSAIGKADHHDKNIQKIQRQATETEGHGGMIDGHFDSNNKDVTTTIPEHDEKLETFDGKKSTLLKEYYDKNSVGKADDRKVQSIRRQAKETERQGDITQSQYVIDSQVRSVTPDHKSRSLTPIRAKKETPKKESPKKESPKKDTVSNKTLENQENFESIVKPLQPLGLDSMIQEDSTLQLDRRDTFDQIVKPLDPTGLNYSKAEPTKVSSGWSSENDPNVVKVSLNNTDSKVNNESGNKKVELEENNKQVFNIEIDNMSKTTEPVSAHFGTIDQYNNQIPQQQREHLLSYDQPLDRTKNISFTVGDEYKTARSGSNNESTLLNIKPNKSGRSIEDDGFNTAKEPSDFDNKEEANINEEIENFKGKQKDEERTKSHERTKSQTINMDDKINIDSHKDRQTFQVTLPRDSEGVMVEEEPNNNNKKSKKNKKNKKAQENSS